MVEYLYQCEVCRKLYDCEHDALCCEEKHLVEKYEKDLIIINEDYEQSSLTELVYNKTLAIKALTDEAALFVEDFIYNNYGVRPFRSAESAPIANLIIYYSYTYGCWRLLEEGLQALLKIKNAFNKEG